jgi:uncharacterized small protein (DUF1192 family)
MSLFGKKVKFEEETAAAGPSGPPMDPPVPSPAVAGAPVTAPLPAPAAAAAPSPAATVAAGPKVAYGIEDAIRLMRSLPVDRNADLVVKVVRHTLESMNVRVADIISDAERKEVTIQASIATRKNDIAELEAGIATCRDELTRLEAELAETTGVKQRLRLADAAAGARPHAG